MGRAPSSGDSAALEAGLSSFVRSTGRDQELAIDCEAGNDGVDRGGTYRNVTSGGSMLSSAFWMFRAIPDICTNGISRGKDEQQPKDLVLVDWVLVQHSDVHFPSLQILGLCNADARWESLARDAEFFCQPARRERHGGKARQSTGECSV